MAVVMDAKGKGGNPMKWRKLLSMTLGASAKTAVVDDGLDSRIAGGCQQGCGTAEGKPQRSNSSAIDLGARREAVDGRNQVKGFERAQRDGVAAAAAPIPHVVDEDGIARPVQKLRIRQHLNLVVAVAVRKHDSGMAPSGKSVAAILAPVRD